MARNGLKPQSGSGEKGKRRHEHQRHAVIQGAEPRTDQTHVMVERQPGHEHVAWRDLRRLPERANIGKQVGVRQHDALRIAGTARRVLQKCDVASMEPMAQWRWRDAHLARRDDCGQTRYRSLQHDRHRLGLRHGDHEHRFGVGQDARVPPQVVLDLGQACRRIDRHRNATRQHHAEKTCQIVVSSG